MFVAIILLAFQATSLLAQGQVHIQEKLVNDLDEISSILKRDHPGSSEIIGDVRFIEHLTKGLARHKSMAKNVTNQNQYNAVLNSYMLGFDDMHLGFRPAETPTEFSWAGMVFLYDEINWTVFYSSPNWSSKLANKGDKLISCDGQKTDYWVKKTLQSSIVNEQSVAQLARYSSWLFIGNNGLPQFQNYPKTCTFENEHSQYSIEMSWNTSPAEVIYPLVFNQPNRIKVGFSIDKLEEGGYWIEIGSLFGSGIKKLIENLENMEDDLIDASFIVLDVRGNLGGDSSWSDRIMSLIFGDSFVKSSLDDNPAEFYKVSHENSELIKSQLMDAISHFGKEDSAALYHQKMYDSMQWALEKGEEFSPSIPQHILAEEKSSLTKSLVSPKFKGKLYFLADYSCFSSCLLMLNKLRKLGAHTVGKVTNSMPRYYDMKIVPLSSGSGSVISMTKVDLNENSRIGPYFPEFKFDGFMDDTKKLQEWFLESVLTN